MMPESRSAAGSRSAVAGTGAERRAPRVRGAVAGAAWLTRRLARVDLAVSEILLTGLFGKYTN
jgi:hypothetical protein